MAKIFDKMFINVLIMGFAFMLVFTAFQTCGMIENIVIKSMNKQYTNYDGDGYISLAIVYAVFAISNWIAPSIISILGAKISMLIGGFCYSLFIGNFFFPQTWILYLASVIIGFGASIFWTGQGNFLTINSDSETMSRNSGVFWALLQCSLLFGNIFVYFKFQGKEEIDEKTRYVVFGVLLVVSLIGLALLLFLRYNKSSSINIQNSEVSGTAGAIDELKKAVSLLKTKEMMCLAITFLYTGFELSFFSGVYGTAVGFTNQLGADAKKFVGISGICIGIGEIIGGALFGILGKKTNKFGRDPVILLGFIVHVLTFFAIYINLPAKSPFLDSPVIQPTIIPSSVALAMICAFGLGFGDACYNTQIYSILGSVYSEDSAPAFALFKFFQSIAAAIAFFYSTKLILPFQLLILIIFAVMGTFTFWYVEWTQYIESTKKTVNSKQDVGQEVK
uniref:UNC93-like protein MFSD11 n=1 Tax=Parasteatoda tepidariorum TaxID=114398 RepID=A0A2L2Y784_PARTP